MFTIGFLYIFDKKSSDGSEKMWRCERKDQQCKAHLHSNAFTGELVRVVGNHTHNSDAARNKGDQNCKHIKAPSDGYD